jgi:hypothetical protein
MAAISNGWRKWRYGENRRSLAGGGNQWLKMAKIMAK